MGYLFFLIGLFGVISLARLDTAGAREREAKRERKKVRKRKHRSHRKGRARTGKTIKPGLDSGEASIRAEPSVEQEGSKVPDPVPQEKKPPDRVSPGSDPVGGPKESPVGPKPSKVKEDGGKARETISASGLRFGRGLNSESPWALIDLPFGVATKELGGGFPSWLSALRIRIEDGTPVVFPIKALCQFFPPKKPPNYEKPEAERIANFFRRGGIGLEPDPTLGGANPSKSGFWAAFPLKASPLTEKKKPETSPAFEAATTVLHLATAVAHADSSVDASQTKALEAHIQSGLRLPATQKRRLGAHHSWLLAAPPNLSGLRDRLSTLSVESRTVVSKVVLAVVGADGRIFPGEVQTLTEIFDLLGIPEEELQAQLDALSYPALPPPSPVPVLETAPPEAFQIPPVPGENGPGSPEILLDPVRLAEIRSETEDIFESLREVFEEMVTLPSETKPGSGHDFGPHQTRRRRAGGRQEGTPPANRLFDY
jgi:tellurite resistance protein